jgi:hypothetical protein
MRVLVVVALALTATLSGLGFFLKSHPPELSAGGVLSLRRGILVGMASSSAVSAVFIAILIWPPVAPSLFWPLALCAAAGNLLNLVALIFCLREVIGESIFTAFILLLIQALWILFALRAVTVDF